MLIAPSQVFQARPFWSTFRPVNTLPANSETRKRAATKCLGPGRAAWPGSHCIALRGVVAW